ncbi:MAG: hypothetical protein OEY59_09140 [Deltaproteobacteria bacterium]|nr:hypothetical protein [Deltaproteobacteria bacterium]
MQRKIIPTLIVLYILGFALIGCKELAPANNSDLYSELEPSNKTSEIILESDSSMASSRDPLGLIYLKITLNEQNEFSGILSGYDQMFCYSGDLCFFEKKDDEKNVQGNFFEGSKEGRIIINDKTYFIEYLTDDNKTVRFFISDAIGFYNISSIVKKAL